MLSVTRFGRSQEERKGQAEEGDRIFLREGVGGCPWQGQGGGWRKDARGSE